MTIILRRFNKHNINLNSVIVIIGEVKSGKSILIKDILHTYKDIPSGIVICDNKNILDKNIYNNTYNYIPPIFIHNSYDKITIKNYIKRQYISTENDCDNRSFIVLDNCLYRHNYIKDKYFKMLLECSKLYNYLCIIEVQYLSKINDILLNNIDYIFILKESVDLNRKHIYEQFKHILGIEYSVFTKILDDYTSNYNLLVLDVKNNSKCIEDKLFWYKANIHDNFKLCDEDCWSYSEQNYVKQPEIKPLRSIFY